MYPGSQPDGIVGVKQGGNEGEKDQPDGKQGDPTGNTEDQRNHWRGQRDQGKLPNHPAQVPGSRSSPHGEGNQTHQQEQQGKQRTGGAPIEGRAYSNFLTCKKLRDDGEEDTDQADQENGEEEQVVDEESGFF